MTLTTAIVQPLNMSSIQRARLSHAIRPHTNRSVNQCGRGKCFYLSQWNHRAGALHNDVFLSGSAKPVQLCGLDETRHVYPFDESIALSAPCGQCLSHRSLAVWIKCQGWLKKCHSCSCLFCQDWRVWRKLEGDGKGQTFQIPAALFHKGFISCTCWFFGVFFALLLFTHKWCHFKPLSCVQWMTRPMWLPCPNTHVGVTQPF